MRSYVDKDAIVYRVLDAPHAEEWGSFLHRTAEAFSSFDVRFKTRGSSLEVDHVTVPGVEGTCVVRPGDYVLLTMSAKGFLALGSFASREDLEKNYKAVQ